MARDYDDDYGGSTHEPYVASQPAPRRRGLGVVLTIVIVIMVVFGGLYGYFYVTSPTGQRTVTDIWGRVSSGVSNFYNYLFVQRVREAGTAFYSANPNDTSVDYGVKFVKFESVGAKKIPAGAMASFKYVVTVGENTPPTPLSLVCNVEPKDVVEGEVKKIPEETLMISSENPALTNNLRCNFKTKDVSEDKTVTVKGSMQAMIPTQRVSLKVYLLSSKEYDNLKGQDFFKINNKPDKLPIKTVYNGEPVEIGIGVAEDLKQPVVVGKNYYPMIGITLTNRWDGRVESINSVTLFLPEGVSINYDLSPKSELCPFSDAGTSPNGDFRIYNADPALLKSIAPFGSGKEKNYNNFECQLSIDESLVAGKKAGFVTAYHVGVSYVYIFNERSDIITVTKKLTSTTETPTEGGAV